MEDLARAKMSGDLDPKKLLSAFSALDGISVSHCDQIGTDLLENLWAVADNPEDHQRWSRTILSPIPALGRGYSTVVPLEADDVQ